MANAIAIKKLVFILKKIKFNKKLKLLSAVYISDDAISDRFNENVEFKIF